MKTYQDLLSLGDNEKDRMDFVLSVISEHESSALYRTAKDAEMYYRHLNPTIMRAQKLIYDALGRAAVDTFAANHKIPSRYYYYFITQETQYLLANGVSFGEDGTKDRLGKDFDEMISALAVHALNGGVAFGFWNDDKLEVFPVAGIGSEPSFAPIYDEENGALMAGVRYWRLDADKPLRCALYEIDGVTEYIRRKSQDITVYQEKRPYRFNIGQSEASGTEIYNGMNWDSLPIIPLFNVNKQSEIVGGRETIDAYDLMASALVNNIDDANLIYWIIKNAGGMDDVDDAQFVQRLKTLHVAHVDGTANTEITSHSVEAPFEANEAALKRLRSQLFDDFMALDVKEVADGAATATQIRAAYEPLNSKADLFEHCVTLFIRSLLALLGIDDDPTYTRSTIVNQAEEIQNLTLAADYLSSEYVTRKVLEIMGDIDDVDEVIRQKESEEARRFTTDQNNGNGNDENEENEKEMGEYQGGEV